MSDKFYSKVFRDPVENLLTNVDLRGTSAVTGGPVATKDINNYKSYEQIQREKQRQADTIAGIQNASGGEFNTSAHADFSETNMHSYSGTDVTVAVVYNQHILLLNNLETFAYSTHLEKVPVRRLGDTTPKNHTYGTRTIAGTMVFVTFDEHPLYGLFQFFNERTAKNNRYSSPMADEIPPFDVILYFSNEAGAGSIMRFYGVEISDEGGVFSINDIYSENTMQWTCKDMDPMISEGKKGSWQALLFQKQLEGKVVDERFAAMLRYRQRLERDAQDLRIQISNINKQIIEKDSNINASQTQDPRDPGYAHSPVYNTNRTSGEDMIRWKNQKDALIKSANLLQTKLDKIILEIQKVDNAINSYENSNMTWDMDASLYGMSRMAGSPIPGDRNAKYSEPVIGKPNTNYPDRNYSNMSYKRQGYRTTDNRRVK